MSLISYMSTYLCSERLSSPDRSSHGAAKSSTGGPSYPQYQIVDHLVFCWEGHPYLTSAEASNFINSGFDRQECMYKCQSAGGHIPQISFRQMCSCY
ncbi:hypothetical protein AMELA_G00165530 [Ameiurus melas]|uniref:Uncharacterized protein n=1 Tax=Ameiurus melas TaxID=219545 RepID=A0A7J6ADD3_AMEME|nr:hypothetical protein AMELA_G00165530 [Ameiurus melas]